MDFSLFFFIFVAQSLFVVLIAVVMRFISSNRYDVGFQHNSTQKLLIYAYLLFVFSLYAFEMKFVVDELKRKECPHAKLCYFTFGVAALVLLVVARLSYKMLRNYGYFTQQPVEAPLTPANDAVQNLGESFVETSHSTESTQCFAFRVTSLNSRLKCGLCKARMQEGSVGIRYVCKHVFDETCIMSRMPGQMHCPVCVRSKREYASLDEEAGTRVLVGMGESY